MCGLQHFVRKSIIGFRTLFLIIASSSVEGQQFTASENESLAAWERIAQVLRHPRCLNCHQLERPLQGDARKTHTPAVVRGIDGLGAGTMLCRNCHNWTGNNEMSGVPGAPHWKLAPISMNWEGLSAGDLCRTLKNPVLNGQRAPEKIIDHVATDKLVLWGWEPGSTRTPVPIASDEFVKTLKVWVAGGVVCPP